MTYYPPKNQAKPKPHPYTMMRDRLMAVKMLINLMSDNDIESGGYRVLAQARDYLHETLPSYPGHHSDQYWLWQAINDPAYRVTGAHPSVPWARRAE